MYIDATQEIENYLTGVSPEKKNYFDGKKKV